MKFYYPGENLQIFTLYCKTIENLSDLRVKIYKKLSDEKIIFEGFILKFNDKELMEEKMKLGEFILKNNSEIFIHFKLKFEVKFLRKKLKINNKFSDVKISELFEEIYEFFNFDKEEIKLFIESKELIEKNYN